MATAATDTHDDTRRTLKLGLIGGNIGASRAPELHRIAGELSGLDTTYDRLIPAELGLDLDSVINRCVREGYRGVNVTYPYKEAVVRRVETDDPTLRRLGAVNTIIFETGRLKGHNTDYTGFAAAYRNRFGASNPGTVALIGAGGVGRAIAFALSSLGADAIRIADRDAAKAKSLARDIVELSRGTAAVSIHADVGEALAGASGVVNATPVGMVGNPGSPVPDNLLPGARWSFDAVYTPVDTQFKLASEAAGLDVLSGYELFFFQGVHAFEIFSGRPFGQVEALRSALDG